MVYDLGCIVKAPQTLLMRTPPQVDSLGTDDPLGKKFHLLFSFVSNLKLLTSDPQILTPHPA